MLAVSGINFAQKTNLTPSSNNQRPLIKMHSQPMQDCVSFCRLPANFGEVISGKLYRSAKPYDFKALKEKGIKYIIDLRDENTRTKIPEKQLVESLGMVYDTAPDGFSDLMPNDSKYLPTLKALAEKIKGLIDKNDGAVLVHCSAGEARTGDVIGAYQYYIEGLLVKDIIAHGIQYNTSVPSRIRALTRFMQTQPQ